MVSESSISHIQEGAEGTNPGRSDFQDAKSFEDSWFVGKPWDPVAPICKVEDLDSLALLYRKSKRKGYRPDKEFLESGYPEYVEWCVKKFINHYDTIDTLCQYKEYREIRKGLSDRNLAYRVAQVISRVGLVVDEELIKDIKLQVFLYYVMFLRNYGVFWRPSINNYNKFSVYFRHCIFLKMGHWLRKKLDKYEGISIEDNENLAFSEEEVEVQKDTLLEPMTQKELSELCWVSYRQIKYLLFDNPKLKSLLVGLGYLGTREKNKENLGEFS